MLLLLQRFCLKFGLLHQLLPVWKLKLRFVFFFKFLSKDGNISVGGGDSYALQTSSPGGSQTPGGRREGEGAEKDLAGDSGTETNLIGGFGPQAHLFTPHQSQFPNHKVRKISTHHWEHSLRLY